MNDTTEATTMNPFNLRDYLAVCEDHDIPWSRGLRVLGSCDGDAYKALNVFADQYDREHPDMDDEESTEATP